MLAAGQRCGERDGLTGECVVAQKDPMDEVIARQKE